MLEPDWTVVQRCLRVSLGGLVPPLGVMEQASGEEFLHYFYNFQIQTKEKNTSAKIFIQKKFFLSLFGIYKETHVLKGKEFKFISKTCDMCCIFIVVLCHTKYAYYIWYEKTELILIHHHRIYVQVIFTSSLTKHMQRI
ncbi:hypothetical protein ACJX0J_009054 [Zea mays]